MNTRTVSERLDGKLQLFSSGYVEAEQRLWAHHHVAELFPSVLFRIHCEARATVRLMTEAVRCLEPVVHGDPLASQLIEYFREHIPQETGHDEWILEALEELGIPRAKVWACPPPPTIAALVGSQYYWIFHHHPVALLGYIKVVESSPTSIPYLEQLAERAGVPLAAFRFHFGHARLDPTHQRELNQLLDALPLKAEQEALIGISAVRTLHYVSQGVDEVISLFGRAERSWPILL
ncbi:MAG TPA: iron-containing redox enzyme family protein [Myxococcaceae bacterium]|jgi:hypothetical protein